MKRFLSRKNKKDQKDKNDEENDSVEIDSSENDSEFNSEAEDRKGKNKTNKFKKKDVNQGKEGKKNKKSKNNKSKKKRSQESDRGEESDIDTEPDSQNNSQIESESEDKRNKNMKQILKGGTKGKNKSIDKSKKEKNPDKGKSDNSDDDSWQDSELIEIRKKTKSASKRDKKSGKNTMEKEKKSQTVKDTEDRPENSKSDKKAEKKKKDKRQDKKTEDKFTTKETKLKSNIDKNMKSKSVKSTKNDGKKKNEIVESDNNYDDDDDDDDDDDEDVEEEGSDASETVKEMSTFKKSANKAIPLENQAKFYQDRTVSVEKHYGQFCQLFGSITRKVARTRDKGDLLSKQLLEYAKQEKISHSTSNNLKEFAHNLAAVQDYRDAEIRRLESKVVKPLSAYGPKCKGIKQLIKREQGAINREIKQRRNLDKVRDKKPGDAQSISACDIVALQQKTFENIMAKGNIAQNVQLQAETEVRKAAESAQIGIKGLQNQMCTFEKDKLTDLKNILADFVSIELVFHAKAIEFYSKCFDNLAMIDDEEDLETFKRKISLEVGGRPIPQGTITSIASEQMMSTMDSTATSEYTSTGASYTYTYGESTGSSMGDKRVRIQTVGQSMYHDADDDDDDDDDEDEDDDDEEEEANYSRPIRR